MIPIALYALEVVVYRLLVPAIVALVAALAGVARAEGTFQMSSSAFKAPSKTALAQGEASAPSPAFASGKQQYGQLTLAAGMTRADLLATIDHHILRASSIVGRFARS
jgi:hypothetical protein